VSLTESGPFTDTRKTVKLGVFHGPNVSIHPSFVRLLILMILGIPRLCAALQIVSVDLPRKTFPNWQTKTLIRKIGSNPSTPETPR